MAAARLMDIAASLGCGRAVFFLWGGRALGE